MIQPFWSVIIPTYQPRADYLRETLESVVQQGHPSMQIEVVDDCSPDLDVAGIVRQFSFPGVTVFRSPTNLGLAGCWNLCASRARGEFVHLLHQDDAVLPGFYDALQRGFDSNAKVGAAFCRHILMDEEGHWTDLPPLEARFAGVLPDFLQRISERNLVRCPAIAVRRSVYEALGQYTTEFPHALDWEMWERIGKKYRVYYEPRPLALYRTHSNSMTSRQVRNGEQITDIFRILAHSAPNLSPARAARARHAHAGYAMDIVRELVNERDYHAALHNLGIILRNSTHHRTCRAAIRMVAKVIFERSIIQRSPNQGSRANPVGIEADLPMRS